MLQQEKKEKMNFRDVRQIFSWYWRLTKKHQKWFWLTAVAFGIGQIFSEVISVVVFKSIIDSITAGVEVEALWRQVALLGGVYLLFFTLFRLGDYALGRYEVPASADLHRFVFSEIQKHSYEFFANRFVGGLTSQMKRFLDGFISLAETTLFHYWMSTVSLVGIFIATSVFSWKLALLFFVTFITLVVIAIPFLLKRMQYDEEEGIVSSKISGYFSDAISNILNIKVFTGSRVEQQGFSRLVDERSEVEKASWRMWNITSFVQQGLTLGFRFTLFVLAVYLWTKGEVTAGTIVMVTAYAGTVMGVVWQITRSTSGMLKNIASAKEMYDVLHSPVSITDDKNATDLHVSSGKIEFQEVTFSYNEGANVFKNLNLTIAPGEKVGLVGPSGGGKSTITKLLLRFVDPTSGAILIDGQDIKKVTQESLRAQIAYVPQDPTLFHRSLAENIGYGRAEAEGEEIFRAAQKAHAHEFIESLASGYKTEVGERGIKLSGGQRQRVAIARAILKDAPILIMDEATSALDTVSETAIREALETMMENKTVLIIAHRLSTVEKLDRIIVLDKTGCVAEEGKHDDLVAHGGLYATLWSHQTGGFLGDESE